MNENTPMSFDEFWAQNFAELYVAERAKEQQTSEEAFVATTHNVCGFQLRGMTPYDLLILSGYENPFVSGGIVSKEHVAQFIAILHEPMGWLARRRFIASVRSQPIEQLIAGINAYMDRMFLSSGVGRRQPSESASADGVAPLSLCFLATLVINVSAETGWSEDEILGMRLDKLFQYTRVIRMRRGEKDIYSPADKYISQALESFDRYREALKQNGL